MHDRIAAEDALVEIYDQARHRAGKFNARRQSPLAWLISLARNVAVNRRGRTDNVPLNAGQDQFKHKRQLANLALARLSGEQRSILEMTYLGGLNAEEVAEVLELPVEYVKQQIVLATQTLKSALNNPKDFTIRMCSVDLDTREVQSQRHHAVE
jgi:RNA polymerase sigma-70 factor (ECF subfamily)